MGVGKSSLISQYIKREFPESPLPTIAIEFTTKIIRMRNGDKIKISDTVLEVINGVIIAQNYRTIKDPKDRTVDKKDVEKYMEDNKTKITDGSTSDTDVSVTTNYGDVITLKTFREEFEWLRSDFWNLMTRVSTLEEENRRLREKINENDYQTISYRNKVDFHEDTINQLFGKMNKVSEYVGEMSKDYIRDYEDFLAFRELWYIN